MKAYIGARSYQSVDRQLEARACKCCGKDFKPTIHKYLKGGSAYYQAKNDATFCSKSCASRFNYIPQMEREQEFDSPEFYMRSTWLSRPWVCA